MLFKYSINKITTKQKLLDFLNIKCSDYFKITNFSGKNVIENYRVIDEHSSPEDINLIAHNIIKLRFMPFKLHKIAKKNPARGHRIAWEPILYKNTFKTLAFQLDMFFNTALDNYPHESSYGFRIKRNIRENAQVHTGKRFLLSCDIENFFNTITRKKYMNYLPAQG